MRSGKYFNKDVKAKNEDYIGRIMEETPDKIIVISHSNKRFHIPKDVIHQVEAMDVRLKIDPPAIEKYRKDDRSGGKSASIVLGGDG